MDEIVQECVKMVISLDEERNRIAMEAIAHAGTSLGIVCAAEGIVLAAERKVSSGSKLLDSRHAHEKIFTISDDIMCVVAGISADANILVDNARLAAGLLEDPKKMLGRLNELLQQVLEKKTI